MEKEEVRSYQITYIPTGTRWAVGETSPEAALGRVICQPGRDTCLEKWRVQTVETGPTTGMYVQDAPLSLERALIALGRRTNIATGFTPRQYGMHRGGF